MDSIGEFHKVQKDGKLFFAYHHPKYHPIPQSQSLIFSGETPSHDLTLQPLFLCPVARNRKDFVKFNFNPSVSSPPEYILSIRGGHLNHPVLPLYWCNNKEFDADGGCNICSRSYFGTNYYFCESCNKMFHKECVQSPLHLKHPYHPEHSLQLFHYSLQSNDECLCCGRKTKRLAYYCTTCQVFMHTVCAMKMMPIFIDPPKKHDHPLAFFPRQNSLICNVCSLLRKKYPTYICVQCNFVTHNDCMNAPHLIKISRHHHNISYIYSLPSRGWSCGVCHQTINSDYGAYICDTCGNYVVHSRCALEKELWDGKDLKGVPVEEDITQDVESFDKIYEGVILHFLHNHQLQLEASIVYDENMFCQACVVPIFEGNIYSCMKCDFILHETCAKALPKRQHALHPHPLKMNQHIYGDYTCNACNRDCGGFIYGCHKGDCDFDLDMLCASVCEPFHYQGHEHPLFLALDPKEKPTCHVCTTECRKQLNCIKCDFILCFKCATLPKKARYKHDQHFLRLLFGEKVCEKYLCEVCENDLGDIGKRVFYWCDECCTAFHIKCLLGREPSMYLGQSIYDFRGKKVQLLGKPKIYRPFCDYCKKRCQDKILKIDNLIACSLYCGHMMFSKGFP